MFEPLFTEESPNTFIYTWAFGRSRTCNLLITNQLLCQLSYEGIIYVKMDKLYLHFTQCFSLTYHQQHRIGCFLTLLSTTLLVVTLPPLTRFIINPHLSLDRVLIRDTPNHVSSIFLKNSNLPWHVKHLTISLPLLICCVTYN